MITGPRPLFSQGISPKLEPAATPIPSFLPLFGQAGCFIKSHPELRVTHHQLAVPLKSIAGFLLTIRPSYPLALRADSQPHLLFPSSITPFINFIECACGIKFLFTGSIPESRKSVWLGNLCLSPSLNRFGNSDPAPARQGIPTTSPTRFGTHLDTYRGLQLVQSSPKSLWSPPY